MENIYTIASTTASTTYGAAITIVKEYLMKLFPIHKLKDVHISSEIASMNIRRRLGRNTTKELSKLERPYMVINPQLQSPNSDLYLYDIPLTKNFDNMEIGVQRNTLFPILRNETDCYTLNYKLNRDQLQFEVSITVDTQIQQIDMYKYILNHFVWERPYVIESSLEAMIPREMILYMGRLSNIDIMDTKRNQIPTMIHMMNRNSRYPITYKMRNGTGLDEFYMYYNAHLLINFTDLNVDSVNRRGMADDYYQLTFRVTLEFNLPGVFVLTGHKPRPKAIAVDLKVEEEGNSYDLIPMYTVNNLYAKYTQDRNGFSLYMTSRFKTEKEQHQKKDTLNLSVLFEQEYLDIFKQYYETGSNMHTLCEIYLIKDGTELQETVDWSMSWDTMNVEITKSDYIATYCIVIYINRKLFNDLIVLYIDHTKNDITKLRLDS